LDSEALDRIAVWSAVSFVAALVAVRWMLATIGRIGFAPSGWYGIALGTVIPASSVLR
jgi:undecaprenyl-diphosphatase